MQVARLFFSGGCNPRCNPSPCFCLACSPKPLFLWSGRLDSNQRPSAPKAKDLAFLPISFSFKGNKIQQVVVAQRFRCLQATSLKCNPGLHPSGPLQSAGEFMGLGYTYGKSDPD